ncbi:MAG: ABC transporter ATP-binding protein [Oscillospiraceae bacterium]|jgi:ABC-2 type transport system ATP-binding protein|nr:ABC transporter ATP-binding protein [Oscillospiraceae bacterium]
MAPILECINLGKNYGSVPALSGVNLQIQRGRIVGLLGPNGSGKTTLIKMANGLLTPSFGSILIDGKAPGVETKKIVSYLPERTYFNEWMKVSYCVELFKDFYGDFSPETAYSMMSALDIKTNAAFRTLSKGTKEKIQLILVMSRKASLYLLDEPIGGVDPAARDYIISTIISNYNENGTVVISTHLIHDIENILDYVVFLDKGSVRMSGSSDELRMQSHKSIDNMFREVFRC